MTEERDPYKVLGVPAEASDADIREAYRARARRLHPDVVGEAGLDEMRALNQAWAELKDPEKRAAHDAAHGRVRPGAGGNGSGGPGSGSATGGPAQGAANSYDLGSQPAWTGAAGPPPGRPWGSVLDFGIYAGWSLGEIIRRDRGYLAWLRDKPEGKRLRQEIDRLMEMSAPPEAPAPQRGRHR
ncbi:MAG TPA: DnaJ domain-containing protein [Candidatus Limnocylindrales bacterium]|nr:DnaJ domain-containing protein [Candidatus Limnocylindrales bacterium]